MPDMTDDQIIAKFADQKEVGDRERGTAAKFHDLANAIRGSSRDPYHSNEVLKKLLWARNAYVRGVPPQPPRPQPGQEPPPAPPPQGRNPRPR